MEKRAKKKSLTRRDFLRTGSLASVGVSAAMSSLKAEASIGKLPVHADHCIFINLVGGPSQLETFDPKAHLPSDYGSPFRPIATQTPGVHFSELLPELAKRSNQFTVIRSVFHDASPIHETGQQLLTTGRVAKKGIWYPHFGATIDWLHTEGTAKDSSVILPNTVRNLGSMPLLYTPASFFGAQWEPSIEYECTNDMIGRASPADRQRFGKTELGRACLAARQWIEQGARTVTINMFESLLGKVTWDAHRSGQDFPSTLQDYQDTLCPELDHGVSALLDDLKDRGILDRTLVIVAGEFGRSPKLNRFSGRDHHTDAWSIMLAGAGTPAGSVIGSTDQFAGTIESDAIHLNQVVATIYRAFGIDEGQQFPDSAENQLDLYAAKPIPQFWT